MSQEKIKLLKVHFIIISSYNNKKVISHIINEDNEMKKFRSNKGSKQLVQYIYFKYLKQMCKNYRLIAVTSPLAALNSRPTIFKPLVSYFCRLGSRF